MATASPLVDLPGELQNEVLSYLEFPDTINLKLTCHHFNSIIRGISSLTHQNLLRAEQYMDAHKDRYKHTYLACCHCVRLRLSTRFADSMTKKNRGIGHTRSHTRFCVDCGLLNGPGLTNRYGKGMCIKVHGKLFAICRSCTVPYRLETGHQGPYANSFTLKPCGLGRPHMNMCHGCLARAMPPQHQAQGPSEAEQVRKREAMGLRNHYTSTGEIMRVPAIGWAPVENSAKRQKLFSSQSSSEEDTSDEDTSDDEFNDDGSSENDSSEDDTSDDSPRNGNDAGGYEFDDEDDVSDDEDSSDDDGVSIKSFESDVGIQDEIVYVFGTDDGLEPGDAGWENYMGSLQADAYADMGFFPSSN